MMTNYLILYDLKDGTHFDYQELYAYLESQRAVQILSSAWLIRSSSRAVDIQKKLKYLFANRDQFIVTEVTNNGSYAIRDEFQKNFNRFYG